MNLTKQQVLSNTKVFFLSHQTGRIFVSTFGDEISKFHHLTSKIFPTKTLISPGKQIIGGHNLIIVEIGSKRNLRKIMAYTLPLKNVLDLIRVRPRGKFEYVISCMLNSKS